MVSHIEDADRALTIRPPPSVASSRHSERRHRRGRSHHGGSSHQSLNEFPRFVATGDVEIMITARGQERRYLLHRLILAQCSGFFEAGTSEEWSRLQTQREMDAATTGSSPSSFGQGNLERGLSRIPESDSNETGLVTSSSRRGSNSSLIKTRWRYELDWENRAEDEEPILVQKVSENTQKGRETG
jgi:hypothetical protein